MSASPSSTATKWKLRGLCRGADPAIFYPEDDEDPALPAKAICAECPVVEACLEHALAAREKAGVWGGMTVRERRRILRRRRRAS